MRTIIIDDERLSRKELNSLLKQFPEIDVIAECSNADDGVKLINEHNPDLIFLDIQMPGKTGFDMLEELENIPHVIFVTAYDEFALKAFEVSAMDYLLKPVEEDRLAEAIKKVQGSKEEKPIEILSTESGLTSDHQIFLKDGEKCWFVYLRDISLFESEGNYVRVYFNNFKPLILKSLNSLDDRLDERTFFRANRKYIINLKWVENIENWFNGGLRVTLRSGVHVEISRRQAAKFKDLMSL